MERINEFLKQKEAESLLRTLKPIDTTARDRIVINGKELINFSSNDYLGLAGHPAIISNSVSLQEEFGTGSSASRLMSGDLRIHHILEESISKFLNRDSSLVFGSGFLANAGTIPALCGRNDVVFSDRLNHASIIDGILLSGVQLFRFGHNDTNKLQKLLETHRGKYKNALVVVESVYSMDGDLAPLKEIAALKKKYDFMFMVDEAHATGVFGKNGRGVVEAAGVSEQVDIVMGTFGKALGSYGAYVSSKDNMIQYLINRARSFIYSTALPPSVIGANLAALKLVEDEPERRNILLENTGTFRNALKGLGIPARGTSQIVPVITGDEKKTIKMAQFLQDNGVYALPVRPPTVPKNESRIRLSLTYHHSTETLKKTAELISEAYKKN